MVFGKIIAELIGKRATYINRFPQFKVGWHIGCQLEPGDILTLTDPHLGLDKFAVRVQALDEDRDGIWSVVTEEFPAGTVGTAFGHVAQPSTPEHLLNH